MSAFGQALPACAEGQHHECSGERVVTSARRTGGALSVEYCDCPCGHTGELPPDRVDPNDPYTELGGEA